MSHRRILQAREQADAIVITVPKAFVREMDLKAGEFVMIELLDRDTIRVSREERKGIERDRDI